jgi:hypothetical protein
MNNFTNPNDPTNEGLKALLRKWLEEKLDTKDFDFELGEHYCSDSSCLHAETILEIKQGTDEVKRIVIAKPLVFVRKWDILNLPLSVILSDNSQRHKF